MAEHNRRTVLRALTIVPVGLAIAPSLAIAETRELRVGMAGPEVRELQIRVAGWAADDASKVLLSISGSFDAPTEAAVRRFQQAHGLDASGVVDQATADRLTGLAAADGSTAHFDWAQFSSPDGSGFAGGVADPEATKEAARRLMYKLEALRHKVGGREVEVRGGFRSAAHQASLRGPADGMHGYGGTTDITVGGLSTYAVYRVAQTCGFSGLGSYVQSWLHCDSRAEHGEPWSWGSGVV
jgi:zinc D-Ala-D-Ala carboxypeptidase